jgi:hydrophobic/amphiphilic exporter-1 (mainly G- bacteria), HAE1 family
MINELRPALSSVPGIRPFLTNPPVINIGSRFGRSIYQLTLQGVDTDVLYQYASKLEEQMKSLPILADVSSDLQLKSPQVNLRIDRDKAKTLEVTPMQIELALSFAYSTRQVSTIYTPTNQYSVILEVDPRSQRDPSMLSNLYVRSARGPLVPLDAVASRSEDVGPLSINHTGQLPSATISFNLSPGVSLGDAVKEINDLTAARPAGINPMFQGAANEFQKSLKDMPFLLAMAVIVIYVVLGILYESFLHPITILSALPLAGFGAILTLLIFGAELSIYAWVGIIMLVGLVKKNGIMMVDFALQAQREEGKGPVEAIHKACVVRFRPIMMTTLAALMAGLPIAMGFGAGAESRRPLGLAVVGGLLFSQTLTLYITPVFYVYMEKLRRFLAGTPSVSDAPASDAVLGNAEV